MLKISYFHTSTHTETFAPLITCVIDDTDGEKCSSRSTKFMTSMNWSSAWLMSGMVLSKASSMCKSMKFWAFNLTPYNAYFILPIIFVNFVNIRQELLRYTCSRILSVSVFCVLQASGVTPLKCGEIHDKDFCCISWKIRQWNLKTVDSYQTYQWMYSGTVLLRHGVYSYRKHKRAPHFPLWIFYFFGRGGS